MAHQQVELQLPQRPEWADESEPAREDRLHRILWRKIADAVTEIGRKNVCFALSLSEALLSKQLDGQDRKKPSFRMLAYCLAHEKTGELGRWLMADYCGYLPPQRPEVLEPEDALRELYAKAQAGEWGTAARESISLVYQRVRKGRSR